PNITTLNRVPAALGRESGPLAELRRCVGRSGEWLPLAAWTRTNRLGLRAGISGVSSRREQTPTPVLATPACAPEAADDRACLCWPGFGPSERFNCRQVTATNGILGPPRPRLS